MWCWEWRLQHIFWRHNSTHNTERKSRGGGGWAFHKKDEKSIILVLLPISPASPLLGWSNSLVTQWSFSVNFLLQKLLTLPPPAWFLCPIAADCLPSLTCPPPQPWSPCPVPAHLPYSAGHADKVTALTLLPLLQRTDLFLLGCVPSTQWASQLQKPCPRVPFLPDLPDQTISWTLNPGHLLENHFRVSELSIPGEELLTVVLEMVGVFPSGLVWHDAHLSKHRDQGF